MSVRSWKKSRKDLFEELDELYDELIEANKAYDKGKINKAKRISSVLCRLFHDGSARSLTTQLSIRKKMCFPDGLYANERLKHVGLPLCVLQIPHEGEDWCYKPICAGKGLPDIPPSQFSTWWGGEVFFAGSGKLTRGKIVTTMRNKEADHIEDEIKEGPYVSMKAQDDMAIKVFECECGARKIEAFGAPVYFMPTVPDNTFLPPLVTGPSRIPGAEFATMRQIGWEAEIAVGSTLAVLKAEAGWASYCPPPTQTPSSP